VAKQVEEPQAAVRKPARGLDPRVLLEFLGASAGIAAFIALVGGALLWLRFDALGLPADRAVTLLPREMLITVGAHALLGPLIAGLIAGIAIWALDDRSEIVLGFAASLATLIAVVTVWGSVDTWSLAVGAILGLLVGVGVGRLSTSNGRGLLPRGIGVADRPMVVTLAIVGIGVVTILSRVSSLQVLPWILVVVACVGVGLVAIFVSMRRNPERSRRPVLWIVFAVFLFTGTVVAVGRTGAEPKMEPVAVLLKDPEQELAGFYVGESSDQIHIAQLRQGSGLLGVSAEPVEAIVSVPRARVIRKALRRPAGLGLADDGREQVETLLENVVAEQRALSGEPSPPAEPVATTAPTRTFAPLVSLHAAEPSAPMAVDEFLDNSRLYWAFRGCPKDKRLLVTSLSSQKDRLKLGKAGGFKQRARCGRGDEYTSADFTRPHGKKRVFADGRPDLTGREGFYLDLADGLRRRELRSERKGEQRVLKSVPVYYERHREKRDERFTYWLFYPFSFPAGTNESIGHEGDWERVSVLAHEVKPGLWRPLSVRYHEHDGSLDVAWADVRKAPDESGLATHPRAYAAKGSHATYRRGGRFLQVLSRGGFNILAVKDDARACPECPLWFTWQRLVDAQTQPWYGFGGAWGQVGGQPDFTGPLGPSYAKTIGGKAPSPETALQQASDVPPNVAPAVRARK
jgi:hypothetical protein